MFCVLSTFLICANACGYVAFALFATGFTSDFNMFTLLRFAAVQITIAFGQMIALSAGEMNLSLGAIGGGVAAGLAASLIPNLTLSAVDARETGEASGLQEAACELGSGFGAAIIGAVLMALVQHDLKRLLAFHAVSQVGYMIMGIGFFSVAGVAAAIVLLIGGVVVFSAFDGSGDDAEFSDPHLAASRAAAICSARGPRTSSSSLCR